MANIRETLQLLEIEAGGPGSGRHPGTGTGIAKTTFPKSRTNSLGKDERKAIREHLLGNGYTKSGPNKEVADHTTFSKKTAEGNTHTISVPTTGGHLSKAISYRNGKEVTDGLAFSDVQLTTKSPDTHTVREDKDGTRRLFSK